MPFTQSFRALGITDIAEAHLWKLIENGDDCRRWSSMGDIFGRGGDQSRPSLGRIVVRPALSPATLAATDDVAPTVSGGLLVTSALEVAGDCPTGNLSSFLNDSPPKLTKYPTGGQIALRATLSYAGIRFGGQWERGRAKLLRWAKRFDERFPELTKELPKA